VISPALPFYLLAASGFIVSAIGIFLPETAGEPLPNTLDEGEKFGREQKFWSMPLVDMIKAKRRRGDDEIAEPPPRRLTQKRRSSFDFSLAGDAARVSTMSNTVTKEKKPETAEKRGSSQRRRSSLDLSHAGKAAKIAASNLTIATVVEEDDTNM
jgi:hypothetical protein